MSINVLFQSDMYVQGLRSQDIVLYPKSGYYISKDGTNEIWGNSKILSSSNEVLCVHHQKTYIPTIYFISEGKLKIFIAEISGTSNSMTLNVYAAATAIDSDTTWNDVCSEGSSRGSLLGSTTLTSANSNSYVLIDIETSGEYLSEYMYGSSAAHGLILELTSITGTAFVRIVGLYCWDEKRGEKQNPVIELTYNYTPTAYPDTVKITSLVTEDAYISEDSFAANFNENIILCERAETGGDEKKALFKFNLNNVPINSDILRALVYIPRNTDDAQREHREIIRRIFQDWDEDYVSWEMADIQFIWDNSGASYDFTTTYDSYNFIVEPDLYTYDITKILQVAFESFGLSTSDDFYGLIIKEQDLIFNSKEFDNSAHMTVEYLAVALNQPPEMPTLVSPTSGTYVSHQPVFIAIINDDNAYGTTEGDDLHFRLEIDDDDEFSSPTSFSTITSTTGWHWSALGDFSDDSIVFPIPTGGYTPGTSKVKFIMSETTSSLAEKQWYWRLIVIDKV